MHSFQMVIPDVCLVCHFELNWIWIKAQNEFVLWRVIFITLHMTSDVWLDTFLSMTQYLLHSFGTWSGVSNLIHMTKVLGCSEMQSEPAWKLPGLITICVKRSSCRSFKRESLFISYVQKSPVFWDHSFFSLSLKTILTT